MPVIDASVIVSWIVQQDANHRAALSWIAASQQAGESWNVPSIILPEISAAVSRAIGQPDVAQRRVADFAGLDEVVVHPVSNRLALSSAAFAAQLAVKGCDAVYVALAAELDDVLVTFDRQQLDRARSAVTVLQPD